VGTAAHRHNKIHAYQLLCNEKDSRGEEKTNSLMSHYAGSLIGHEDWITCFDWSDSAVNGMKVSVLASGSQDARIRLWNFSSTTTSTADAVVDDTPAVTEIANDSDDDDDSVDNDVAEDDEEGESRLEIVDPYDPSVVTRVTLEALLIAHEESVTSVTWHPDPRQVYGIDLLLISSSMDRTILLWGPASDDGIWTPLTRVGSAGGILGGSVGSSLLGFCRASVEPEQGRCLVGHAYGGTLHFWSLDEPERDNTEKKDNPLNEMPTEERAALVQWKATPCLTGHFNGVTDLCWEASAGEYLLTVSNDQTCRLWAPVAKADEDGDAAPIWVELARPQVHGYDLSAVASLSTETHPHLLVTGADEKELRAFDAPKTTTRILKAVTGYLGATDEAAKERVERAYIPSLGLSNKASASEGAEEDKVDAVERSLESSTVESMRLPLERDLGAVSLWPEIQKFFGHNTEIYCLASTLAGGNVLLASSAKARDVDAAAIRLWNVCEGKCVQVLSGGHKSTVATLSFSANGWFLASAGKDRRLCIWKRSETNQCDYSLVWARDSAHKRIIWSVHFCLFDDAVLLSGSRDGCMKAWRLEDAGDESLQVTEMHSFAPSFHRSDGKPDSVTALSVCPVPMDQNGTALLAVGLESGRIELWQVPLAMQSRSETPQLVTALTPGQCHISTVTKLAWKPFKNDVSPEAKKTLLLASSSMDHGCRIFEVSIEG
jgi:elongator complex protein 2